MKSKASSLIKSFREGFYGNDNSTLVELNSNRIGLPFVGLDRKEVPLTMVISGDQSSFSYAKRNGSGIIITAICVSEPECCSFAFKSSEIELLTQFNTSSTSELNMLKMESQYPSEISNISNMQDFGTSLFDYCNIDVHSPSLSLHQVNNAWDSSLKIPGTIIIVIGTFTFGISEETRGAIFKVLDNGTVEAVYNPDFGSVFNSMSFDSSAWNNLFSSGVKIYTIDPESAKNFKSDSIPESLEKSNTPLLDPMKYRISLSKIHGDKAIKNQIMEAIDFSQEFNTFCEKRKLEYYESLKPSNSKDFRNMIGKLTKLDFEINEAISKYDSYTRKLNEGRDEYILSLEKRSLDSSTKNLFNLVSDLKSDLFF